jgi:hypothetical protein
MLEVTIPNLELYFIVTAIKTAWYWQKNIQEDHLNRNEDSDSYPPAILT